jgi:DNA-binding PadR family transcriptional regulator
MISQARNRFSPEYAILGFLYRTPDHGYDLHKRISNELGTIWQASQSQTYNILNRLEAKGFIEATYIDQEKLPARQLLHITEHGRQRFEEWLDSPTNSSVHAIRVEFITRLYFLKLYFPGKVEQAIDMQLEVVKAGLDLLDLHRKNISEEQSIEQLALDLRIKLLASLLDWLDECYLLAENKPDVGVSRA